MIGRTLAHYEITGHIGKGGMGEVYRARDTKLDRDVALKILPKIMSGDPERTARFEREARTLASLQHANIASIYGYEEVDGVRFLALELVEGEDLAARLARGPMPLDEVLNVALQVAIGLEAAHEHDIIHRDLKPANVKVTPQGIVKILDFGLARVYTDTTDEDPTLSPTITAALTQAGTILGTAAYMSPEQARGKAIDKRADIWSFGVMLYELLTGSQLFAGETITDILGAIVHGKPDLDALPSNVPPAVCWLLERCLTPDVHERLRDIGEARIILANPRARVDGASVVASAAAPSSRMWRIVAIVAMVAVVGLGGRLILDGPQPRRVVHAGIELPKDHTLLTIGARGGAMRVSPDGSALAFVAETKDMRQIWVRSLSEPEGHPIQGTEGGHRPFWSPDGRSIGFFSEGSVRRVAVTGGAPLTIAAASDGRGGAWLENGLIVFAPNPGSSLYAVPAGGGETRQVTDAGKRSHREPRRLPGRDRFLFVEDRGGGAWGVCVGSTDASPHVEVGTTGGGAEYASGRLLYLRGRTLVAQPFDTATPQLHGEPTPIAENVIRDTNFGIGAFSAAEGGVLCYQTGSGVGSLIKWIDRSGDEIAVDAKRAEYSSLRLSPDARTIAAAIDDDDGNSDFWLIDVETGTRQRFTFTPDGMSRRRTQPAWAPDGSLLVYTCESDGQTALYSKRIDGSGREEVLLEEPGLSLWSYDVSPDGQWVLYGREEGDSNEDLWIAPLTGDGEPRALFDTPFDEWPGAFSPKSRWIAFDSDETGRREVYVIPFSEGAGRWQVSRDGGRFPRWNGDGTELYFIDPSGTVMAAPVDVTGRTFVSGEPVEFFQSDASRISTSRFDVDTRGQRILVVEEAVHSSPISVFLNWDRAVEGR